MPAIPGMPPAMFFHLVGEFFIDAPRRFIHGGANQVLEHFLVFVGEHVGLDADVNDFASGRSFFTVTHAAAGRSFHSNSVHLPLQVFLDLPQTARASVG